VLYLDCSQVYRRREGWIGPEEWTSASPRRHYKTDQRVKNGLVEVKNGPVQRNLHNFLLQKLWRPMKTCWKACRVYFPMNLVATSLDTPYYLQTRISTDFSEGQQSVVTEFWYNLPCKTVPIINVSWCMAYIAGKLLEFSFTPKKRFVIWTSQ